MSDRTRRIVTMAPTKAWVNEIEAGLRARIATGPNPEEARNALGHVLGAWHGAEDAPEYGNRHHLQWPGVMRLISR